jgi:hypothetical protein
LKWHDFIQSHEFEKAHLRKPCAIIRKTEKRLTMARDFDKIMALSQMLGSQWVKRLAWIRRSDRKT